MAASRPDAGIAGDLVDYVARSYDPALARFIQPDTIVPQPGDPQSLNRYSYAANNPVRYTDPSGHYIFEQDPEDVQFIVPPNVNPTGQPIGVATWDEVATFAPATTGEFFAVISMPFWGTAGMLGGVAMVEAGMMAGGMGLAKLIAIDNATLTALAPKVVHGLIGAGTSALGNLTVQGATAQGSLSDRWAAVDWGDVIIAGGVGFFSGGASSWASSRGGTAFISAAANAIQYVVTQVSNQEPIDANALVVNAATGGAVGAFVGPAPRAGEVFDESGMWLDPSMVRRLNALADLRAISLRDFARSFLEGLINNLRW